ncbi:hypothetical protein RJ55_07495 [Drechmeria coniospora]|nr:hypothetical protein RJ55_07495 [Drechmeria coniospora]
MSRHDPPPWRGDERDRGGGDNYRPRPRRDREPSPRADSWRRSDRSLHQKRGYDSYRSSAPGSYRAGDSHEPYRSGNPPAGDFNFRVPQPGGSHFSFTPVAGPPSGRPGPRRDHRGPPRKPGRPYWRPPHPSERALVSADMLLLPAERVHDPLAADKFRRLDDLSDSDEVAMEISSQESQSDAEGRARKRARTDREEQAEGDASAAPRWSNPDPYTALPCPDESTRKKRDMVKLIRKARVEDVASSKAAAAPPKAEDYIAIDLSSEGEGDDERRPSTEPASRLPTASQSERHRPAAGNGYESAPTRDGPLGSRKRTAHDEIKPPDYGQLKRASMKPSKGLLVPSWAPKEGEEPCPWATVDHTEDLHMTIRLHKEIVDFYEYVRPREFEQRIRAELVDNIRRAMQRDGRTFTSFEILPFGSYMSELYLPTSDMDLVVCSAAYLRNNWHKTSNIKSLLYKFRNVITTQGIANRESIEVIAHARIPLVKFVDKRTGLKVDVSFENIGGVHAVDTFLAWKKDYPAMPILVTVIKHFLLMRGLNEPVNGGIGGFSVICLVVSMLQMRPDVQSRSMKAEHHLGELLLHFFDLYGRYFNYESNAISLARPVGYVRKSAVRSFTYKNRDRLSIIDPNDAGNDISGGSSNTPSIVARFHDAFLTLSERMRYLAKHPGQDVGSILEVILKGDYSSFRLQRAYLKHVHEESIGPCSD